MNYAYYINALSKLGYFGGNTPTEWNGECLAARDAFSDDYGLPYGDLPELEEPHLSKIGEIYKLWPEGVNSKQAFSKVRVFQRRLKSLGKTIAVDGIHGPNTISVMQAFQSENNITNTKYFDKRTILKLEELTKESENINSLINYLVDNGFLGSEYRNSYTIDQEIANAITNAFINDELPIDAINNTKIRIDLAEAVDVMNFKPGVFYEIPIAKVIENSENVDVKNLEMGVSNRPMYYENVNGKDLYRTPYDPNNIYGLVPPVPYNSSYEFDVSNDIQLRPSRSEYGWRAHPNAYTDGERKYYKLTWHNGVDIYCPRYSPLIAVDRGIAHEYSSTNMYCVAIIFLDQEKYGGDVLVNDLDQSYDDVKNKTREEIDAWASNLTINRDSFRSDSSNGVSNKKLAYALYSHVLQAQNAEGENNEYKRPVNGTYFERGDEIGKISSNTGMEKPGKPDVGQHLHFELHIPKNENALVALTNNSKRFFSGGEGSVDPRLYIDFKAIETWGLGGPRIY